jgi:hypothetical protein
MRTTDKNIGEIGAALCAGFITPEEAIAIAYYRGLAASKLCEKGAMMAIGLHYNLVNQLISNHNLEPSLCVACINSPNSTTVSGDTDALDTLFSVLQSQGVFAQKLKTDNKAYHSPLMKPAGQYYEDLLTPVFSKRKFRPIGNGIRMFSSVTGVLADQDLVGNPTYWRKNLESPVIFPEAIDLLLSFGPHNMIEVGPHPSLVQPVRDILQHAGDLQSGHFATLSRKTDNEIAMLNLAGALYLRGYEIPFSTINGLDLSSFSEVTVHAEELTPPASLPSSPPSLESSCYINIDTTKPAGLTLDQANFEDAELCIEDTNEFGDIPISADSSVSGHKTKSMCIIHDLPPYAVTIPSLCPFSIHLCPLCASKQFSSLS